MTRKLDTLGAWLLGLLWILPLAYAVWAAFHPPAYATRFDLLAPLTLEVAPDPHRLGRMRRAVGAWLEHAGVGEDDDPRRDQHDREDAYPPLHRRDSLSGA